jgi:hypothetical protein
MKDSISLGGGTVQQADSSLEVSHRRVNAQPKCPIWRRDKSGRGEALQGKAWKGVDQIKAR